MPTARIRIEKSLLIGKTLNRKGPYTADLMATTQKRTINYSLGWARASSLLLFAVTIGCGQPDPRSVRGAIEAALADIAANDPEALYLHIDERARHALGGIIVARHKARDLIDRDYPQSERTAALEALGDAVAAKNAAALFAMRCSKACMKQIEADLAAPVQQEELGDEIIVHTSRGTRVRLHLGGDTWYGLVWHTQELMAERDHASRELQQVEQNAALYRKQRSLQTSASNPATE